jgi:hypothetical protein
MSITFPDALLADLKTEQSEKEVHQLQNILSQGVSQRIEIQWDRLKVSVRDNHPCRAWYPAKRTSFRFLESTHGATSKSRAS